MQTLKALVIPHQILLPAYGSQTPFPDLVPAASLVGAFAESPAMAALERRIGCEGAGIGASAAALEFALEGLHLSRRLNKSAFGATNRYRGRDLHLS